MNIKRNVYFTVQTGQQGFTDQLMQLSAFYKLGRACGYRFYFMPFKSERSRPFLGKQSSRKTVCDTADIYDFLGINSFFNSQPTIHFHDSSTFEVNLSDSIIEKERISSLDGLIRYVKCAVSKRLESGEINEPLLVILRLDRAKPARGKGKRDFFALINQSSKADQFSIDFRAIYDRKRLSEPMLSWGDVDTLKVLIHIRQGDTAVLYTPWKTYVPVDTRRPDYLEEYLSLDKVKSRYYDKFVDSIFSVADYDNFWESFKEKCVEVEPSVQVFSDGLKRAVNKLLSNSKTMSLSDVQKNALKEQMDYCDNETFKPLIRRNNLTCHIGETQESLFKLVESTLKADLVITSAQQRMLPKLVANYSSKTKPIVIVLYRNLIPDYSDIMAMHNDRFIYVNIDKPDWGEIKARLTDTKSDRSVANYFSS